MREDSGGYRDRRSASNPWRHIHEHTEFTYQSEDVIVADNDHGAAEDDDKDESFKVKDRVLADRRNLGGHKELARELPR
ncbi:hypothetical protein D9619_007714 [Psilocybe cf. subviscida]|nr:hypothetical protein D9619_007714 [Psilocybe cf. subviscida]